ncbi:MAG: hypothetical protein ACXWJW_11020 [Xanthobacteraceae bacterium]
MYDSDRPNLAAAGIFAAAVVACVTLTAGYMAGTLVHTTQITFNDRWPAQPIAQLGPAATKDIVERYRG